MCNCDNTLLSTQNYPTVVEQSPTGRSFVYGNTPGVMAEVVDDALNEVEWFTVIRDGTEQEDMKELVVTSTHVWYLGLGGIMRIPIAFIDANPGTEFDTYDHVYTYHIDESDTVFGAIDDFDVAGGYCFWIKDRVLYRMGVDDFGGTPEEIYDFTSDFSAETGSNQLRISADDDRLWITISGEADPTLYLHSLAGTRTDSIQLTSAEGALLTDMTVERDTGVLVIVARSNEGSGPGEPESNQTLLSRRPLRVWPTGRVCQVVISTPVQEDSESLDLEASSAYPKTIGHGATKGFVVVLEDDNT